MAAQWRGVYHDGPIAVRIVPNQESYVVGDTFRLSITATNTSDRQVLVRRNWREQLTLYHIHPTTGEQIEWPGRVCVATWVDSSDVVRLEPGEGYTVQRLVRTWIPDDIATFDFRLKLTGVKDYAYRYDMWQGIAWSNALRVTVSPKPE
jgi:hypothetical protein